MNKDTRSALRIGRECFLRIMGQRYVVQVLGVAKDTIWVSFPGGGYPVEGMGAELEFYDNHGLLYYHTRVQQGAHKPGDGLVLQRSEAATYLKHRRTWRVRCDLPAWLLAKGLEEWTEARLIDLSQEGALVESEYVYPVGEIVGVRMTLPSEAPIDLQAQIAHAVRPKLLREYKLGLRFTAIARPAQEIMTMFLWKRIREKYPKEIETLYPRAT